MAEAIAVAKNAPTLTSIVLRCCVALEMAAVLAVATDLFYFLGNPQLAHIALQLLRFLPMATFIVLMFWCYRTNKMLEDLLHNELTTSAPLAAFWFIVPIASLWKPYGVVREIYLGSRDRDQWREGGKSRIVAVWWAFYIISGIAAVGLRLLRRGGMDTDTSGAAYGLNLLLLLAMFAQMALLFVIVSRVIRWLKAPPRVVAAADVF